MSCVHHMSAPETLLTIWLHAAQEAATASACANSNLAAACCVTRRQSSVTLSLCRAAASTEFGPRAVRLLGHRQDSHLCWEGSSQPFHLRALQRWKTCYMELSGHVPTGQVLTCIRGLDLWGCSLHKGREPRGGLGIALLAFTPSQPQPEAPCAAQAS